MISIVSRHRLWIKLVAMVVVCLFTLNTVLWADPTRIISISSENLQVQSIFKPILDVGEWEAGSVFETQLGMEVNVIISRILQSKRATNKVPPFQDINALIDEWCSYDIVSEKLDVKNMKRLLNVVSNPKAEDDFIEVEVELFQRDTVRHRFLITVRDKDIYKKAFYDLMEGSAHAEIKGVLVDYDNLKWPEPSKRDGAKPLGKIRDNVVYIVELMRFLSSLDAPVPRIWSRGPKERVNEIIPESLGSWLMHGELATFTQILIGAEAFPEDSDEFKELIKQHYVTFSKKMETIIPFIEDTWVHPEYINNLPDVEWTEAAPASHEISIVYLFREFFKTDRDEKIELLKEVKARIDKAYKDVQDNMAEMLFEVGEEMGAYGHRINGGKSTGRGGADKREIILVDFDNDKILRGFYESFLVKFNERIVKETGNKSLAGLFTSSTKKERKDVHLPGEVKGKLIRFVYDVVMEMILYDGDYVGELSRKNSGKPILIGDAAIGPRRGVCRHHGIVVSAILEKLLKTGYIRGQVFYVRNKYGPGHGWAEFRDSQGNFYVIDVAQEYFGPKDGYYKDHLGDEADQITIDVAHEVTMIPEDMFSQKAQDRLSDNFGSERLSADASASRIYTTEEVLRKVNEISGLQEQEFMDFIDWYEISVLDKTRKIKFKNKHKIKSLSADVLFDLVALGERYYEIVAEDLMKNKLETGSGWREYLQNFHASRSHIVLCGVNNAYKMETFLHLLNRDSGDSSMFFNAAKLNVGRFIELQHLVSRLYGLSLLVSLTDAREDVMRRVETELYSLKESMDSDLFLINNIMVRGGSKYMEYDAKNVTSIYAEFWEMLAEKKYRRNNAGKKFYRFVFNTLSHAAERFGNLQIETLNYLAENPQESSLEGPALLDRVFEDYSGRILIGEINEELDASGLKVDYALLDYGVIINEMKARGLLRSPKNFVKLYDEYIATKGAWRRQPEQTPGNIYLRSARSGVNKFDGYVWVNAGSMSYRFRTEYGKVRMQQMDKQRDKTHGVEVNIPIDGKFYVGRSSTRGNAYVVSDDSSLSGVHFSIRFVQNGADAFSFEIIDQNSLNGTRVEWTPIEEVPPTADTVILADDDMETWDVDDETQTAETGFSHEEDTEAGDSYASTGGEGLWRSDQPIDRNGVTSDVIRQLDAVVNSPFQGIDSKTLTRYWLTVLMTKDPLLKLESIEEGIRLYKQGSEKHEVAAKLGDFRRKWIDPGEEEEFLEALIWNLSKLGLPPAGQEKSTKIRKLINELRYPEASKKIIESVENMDSKMFLEAIVLILLDVKGNLDYELDDKEALVPIFETIDYYVRSGRIEDPFVGEIINAALPRLKEAILQVISYKYEGSLGDKGLGTLNSIVIPRAVEVYGGNLAKLNKKLRAILTSAKRISKEGGDVDSFLREAIPESHLKYVNGEREDDKKNVFKKIREVLATSGKNSGVAGIVIGGSWAKGTFSPNSDIDILVVYDRNKDFERDRTFEFVKALHEETGREIERFYLEDMLSLEMIESGDVLWKDGILYAFDPFIVVALDERIEKRVEMYLNGLIGEKKLGTLKEDVYAEKQIKKTRRLSHQILSSRGGIEAYLLKNKEVPIDIVVDLSLIPKEDMEENIETWAYLIMMTRNLENVNFIFEHPYSQEGAELSSERANDLENAVSAIEVVTDLKATIEEKALSIGLEREVKDVIKTRINTGRRQGAVEVPITSKAWLEWLRMSREKGKELSKNQYPIALEGFTFEGEEIALWNFEAALTIGLTKAALVIAKDKGELDELVKGSKLLDRLNELYASMPFEQEIRLTEETIVKYMISSSPTTRINLAISLAIPPITRNAVSMLRALHDNIQLALMAA